MYFRQLSQTLERLALFYPIVGIMGPRQSGKTTLARSFFKNLPYVSLEDLDTRAIAQGDPRGFLNNYPQGAIFDEIQHVPELFSYLQGIVDNSQKKGRYVITGSQNFALTSHISQSLPGRIGMTTLLPLSLSELNSSAEIYTQLFKGGYPGLHQLNMPPIDFYSSYIQTYIERDVRQIKNIGDFSKFQMFLKLCAGRIGQLMNLSSLSQDCGISHTTARQWLTVLEASYLVFLVQPFHQNFNKRLTKMAKLYFCDTGLACTLLGLEKAEQLQTHYLKGALFENIVMLELLKARFNKGLPGNLYFWRDKTGHEIDCIAEWGGQIKAIEIKSSMTFQNDFIKGLRYFHELSKKSKNYLIYNGSQDGAYLETQLVPLKNIDKLLTEE